MAISEEECNLMYEAGDMVVYGSMGVCRIEAVGAASSPLCDEEKSYYTLVPLHKSGCIYTPTDTTTFMRPVVSHAEANTLIEKILDVDESVFETRGRSLLKQHYKGLLDSHDLVDLVHVIKSLFVKQRSLACEGKSLGQVETQYMKQAEVLLYDELAVALDVPREEVNAHVEEAVEAARERALSFATPANASAPC
jgi:CarD family transcriptional regulator